MQLSFDFYHEVLTGYARRLIRRKARQLVRRADFSFTDEDDVVQELTMHLLTQASSYDPIRATAGTFATAIVESGIAMLLRKRSRQSRKPEDVEIESLHAMVEVPGEVPVQLQSLISVDDISRRTRSFAPSELEAFEERESFGQAFEQLPQHLQRICNELMSFPPKVAAPTSGLTRRQMGHAMDMIRDHFINAGLDKN